LKIYADHANKNCTALNSLLSISKYLFKINGELKACGLFYRKLKRNESLLMMVLFAVNILALTQHCRNKNFFPLSDKSFV